MQPIRTNAEPLVRAVMYLFVTSLFLGGPYCFVGLLTHPMPWRHPGLDGGPGPINGRWIAFPMGAACYVAACLLLGHLWRYSRPPWRVRYLTGLCVAVLVGLGLALGGRSFDPMLDVATGP